MKQRTILLTILVVFIALGFSVQSANAQGQVIGQVVDGRGNPVGGVEVTIHQMMGHGDRGYSAQTETNGDGEFEFNQVPAGNYVVMARNDAGGARAEVEVQNDQIVEVILQLEGDGRGGDDERGVGTVVGIVQTPDGDPVGGATITLQQMNCRNDRRERMLRTESDRRGMFNFADVPAGRYVVTAMALGGMAHARLEVVANQRNHVRLVLQRVDRRGHDGRGGMHRDRDHRD